MDPGLTEESIVPSYTARRRELTFELRQLDSRAGCLKSRAPLVTKQWVLAARAEALLWGRAPLRLCSPCLAAAYLHTHYSLLWTDSILGFLISGPPLAGLMWANSQ